MIGAFWSVVLCVSLYCLRRKEMKEIQEEEKKENNKNKKQ